MLCSEFVPINCTYSPHGYFIDTVQWSNTEYYVSVMPSKLQMAVHKTKKKTGKLNLNIKICRGKVVNPLPQTPQGEPFAKPVNSLVWNTNPKQGSSIATRSNRYSQRRCKGKNILARKMHLHTPFQGAFSGLLANTLDKLENITF